MKKSISNNKKEKEQTAAVLTRLSRDDNLDGESNSIQNQKILLERTVGWVCVKSCVGDNIQNLQGNIVI